MGSNLELDQGDDFIFGADVSGSMTAADGGGGLSRIEALKEKIKTFINEAAKYDGDGVDLITFGHQIKSYRGVTPEKASSIVDGLQANEAKTNTHLLITEAYKFHVEDKNEQTVLFIATDGAPSEPKAVIDAIVNITKKLKDENEFAISFLTVGTIDANLQAFLTDLDDNLVSKHGALYDIVDIKALADVDFTTAFVAALND